MITEHTCRSCGRLGCQPILSLGRTPLANRLLKADQLGEPEPLYPLDLVFCPHCSLVQITETIPPEELFRDYVYFTSFADSALQNARSIVERLVADRRLSGDSLAVEVASNDGYLLQFYKERGVPVLGIEPAYNIARVADQRGIPTIPEFFDEALAYRLRGEARQADVIHANNVLAHVANLNSVIAGLGILLKPGGLLVTESPYLRDMVEGVEFDQVYHEHLCYYSLTAQQHLFGRHGLFVQDAEHLPIHGGSLRLFVGHQDRPSDNVKRLLQEEETLGMHSLDYYSRFRSRVKELRSSLLDLLGSLKDGGSRIAAYGASAKGTTLLSCLGIGAETLDYVADRSTAKQGFFTPGTHLPIHPPEKLLEDRPDYTLLLTWNFAEEILAQQAEYRRLGGRFIIPIPRLQVI